jgi:protein-L-isoaspartate(D-aspartate) O-methyltransferase
MTTLAFQRRQMVDTQLRTNDVTDLAVLAAFDAVPRERFAGDTPIAYSDHDLVVLQAPRRVLAPPAALAKLIQAAEIRPTDRVLVVGAGTGYAAAVVARLAGTVVALESEPALADRARHLLDGLGLTAVKVVTGPVTAGAPGDGPFDVILADGALAVLPPALLDQLAEGGRLAAVEGVGLAGRARLSVKAGGDVSARHLFNWSLPVVPGSEPAPHFVF